MIASVFNLPKLISPTDSTLSISLSNTSEMEPVFITSRAKITINTYYKEMYNINTTHTQSKVNYDFITVPNIFLKQQLWNFLENRQKFLKTTYKNIRYKS